MKCTTPGVIPVYKPVGPSSAAIVGQVKRQLNLAKLGHAGTLDPPASGVLILLANKATRLADRASFGKKEYQGSFCFGVTTDSDDLSGAIIHQSNELPNRALVEEKRKAFIGRIQQVPPQISAVKVDGKRAYALARKGEAPVLKARETLVEAFDVDPLEGARWRYHIRCGKGTYVRSLIRDLGEAVGCGAAVETLERSVSEPFCVSDSTAPDKLTHDSILSWDILFQDTAKLAVSRDEAVLLLRGDTRALAAVSARLSTDVAQVLYYHESTPLGILKQEAGLWKFDLNIGMLEEGE